MKACLCCGNTIDSMSIHCKNCGLLKDVICDKDIKLIKSDKLKIINPRFVVAVSVPAMARGIQRLTELLGKKELSLNESIFLTYCYSSALNLAARKKKGIESVLRKIINAEFLLQSLPILQMRSPFKEEYDNDDIMEYGLNLYMQLDRVFKDIFPVAPEFTAPKSSTISKIGEIVYGEKKNYKESYKLFIIGIPLFAGFLKTYSKFFIIEEADFKWEPE